jgi:hypothetical protein
MPAKCLPGSGSKPPVCVFQRCGSLDSNLKAISFPIDADHNSERSDAGLY